MYGESSDELQIKTALSKELFQSQLTDFPMYRLAEVEVAALYPRIRETKEGCGGAVWADLEVPAGIDRKDHVENWRVDEHIAYID
ncbi:hypothetical protein T08_15455 [Trichinella sp. T8]|nr:hypothetical protein T08_15455 [Trichinella sp. T8]